MALTTFGEQLASLRGGFHSDVLIDMLNYGIVVAATVRGNTDKTAPSGAAIDLTTADKGFTPPGGAVTSCAGTISVPIFVGAHTACPFADAVYQAYVAALNLSTGTNPNVVVRAVSPVKGRTYTMTCVGDSPHICTGGVGFRVVFYNLI